MGLPVLRTLSLCTCCRHYPGAAAGRTLRSASPSRISLPRKGCRVGLRIVLFEDCSAFTRVTACTLALSPIRDTLTRGFSHFVTSMTAPVASGWSVCRVGLAPTGKRRLCHGAHPTRTCYELGTSPLTHQALAVSVNGPSWRSPSKRLRIRVSSCCRRSSGSDTTNAPPGPAPFVNGSQ
jgi:hypothetical protein